MKLLRYFNIYFKYIHNNVSVIITTSVILGAYLILISNEPLNHIQLLAIILWIVFIDIVFKFFISERKRIKLIYDKLYNQKGDDHE